MSASAESELNFEVVFAVSFQAGHKASADIIRATAYALGPFNDVH